MQRSAKKMFDEYDVENCIIECIEDYPCKSKKELEARQGHHTKLNGCFNKRIEGRTDKEYRDDIVEREKERHKEVKARVDEVVEWYTTRKTKRNRQEINQWLDEWQQEVSDICQKKW